MKASDFLHSRWMDLARTKGAEKKVRKEFDKWTRSARNSDLVKRGRQLWDYFNSGKVSNTEKVVLLAALLYLLSPVDLVPDSIPVVGWLDDVGVAGLVLDYVLKRMDEKSVGKGKFKTRGKKTKGAAGPILKAVRKALK
jgi:uncharacterized membrane protein YkvA (DUF1232 family)